MRFSAKFFLISATFFLTANLAGAVEPHPDCVAWFKRGKVKVGSKDCEMQCALLGSDMATFMCPDQCKDLCIQRPEESLLGRFIFYPGLTPAEKNLIAKRPKDALTAYKQKNIAESSAARNFPDQNLNDESDAFRHFLWAALLTKELGKSNAKKFLDAHEADPDQPVIERQMDEHNNERGQKTADALLGEKRWSLQNIENRGLDELRSKQLKVLKPGLSIPKEPR